MIDYDNHYIANTTNARIDTSPFSQELTRVLESEATNAQVHIESLYWKAFSWTNVKPQDLPDDALICRYLTPHKYLKFLTDLEIFFPTSSMFSDPWECTIHPDYDAAIQRALSNHKLDANSWENFVESKKTEWNVSCWTLLESYHDDNMLWSVYAGGPIGVGITIRYGILRDYLKEVAAKLDVDGQLQFGRVSYSELKLLPFNKHPIFRSENEVRFAFRHFQSGPKGIDITPIRQEFGLRISPAASFHDYETAKKTWVTMMDNERVQWPGRS